MKSAFVLALLVALPAVAVSQAIDWSPLCGGDTGITCPPISQHKVTPDNGCTGGVSTWKNAFGYNDFFGQPYTGRCSFFGGKPALAEGLGWFIIVGLGGVYSLAVSFFIWFAERTTPTRHQDELHTSEHFNSAGRTIKAGLCACDIVSKWTWAATLLQSSNVAYAYGVSGPFWYAAGATIQVLLFSVLAIEIKRKCPSIHTVLEIVLARWGTAAHLVFLFFCIMTNFIVTAMLILGGAAVVNAVTGVDIYAASMLIPISVIFYTAQGGLIACFVSSWGHVTVIYIALIIFMWKIYAGPSELGSTDKVWENLMVAGAKYEVPNNYAGSYLTMWSRSGIIFGIINIIGNFGTVFVDQSYWQGAIAAKPAATYKGYLLGGIAWFAIPFSMATTLGLAGRAFDLPITMDESGSGLVPPAVAIHLLGPGGAFLITFQLFMAVTATGSSEQIAVSSLFVYDVYKRYFNPNVTGKQIIFISRIMIAVWGVVSGVLAIILLELKINLGWVYQAMGNFIGSAVAPIVFSLMWKGCTANGAIAGAIGGLIISMICWFSIAGTLESNPEGIISVATLGNENAFLGANIAALFSSPIFAFIVSAAEGFQNYDFEELNKTTETYLIEEDRHAHKDTQMLSEDSPEAMDIAYTWTVRTGSLMTFVLIIAWPLLALPQYTFSKSYFGFWVAIAFIWGHAAAVITIILPIWESREFLLHMFGIKKMDFSATARERPDYQPDGSVALREVKMDAAPAPAPMAAPMSYGYPMPMPMMAGSPQMMPMATMPMGMPMGGSPVMGMPMGSYPAMGMPMGSYPAMPMGAPTN
jgi:SSS family transporter